MILRVKAWVHAWMLVILTGGGVFAQVVYTVGAPAGSPYNGTTVFNLALNREGTKELFPPVSICANRTGSGGGTNTFDAQDIFRVNFVGTTNPAIVPAPLAAGSLSGTGQIATIQSLTSGTAGLSATATAEMAAVPIGPVARVNVVVTSAPTANSGSSCLILQNLRFNIAGTTGASAGAIFTVSVEQVQEGTSPVSPVSLTLFPGLPCNPATLCSAETPADADGGSVNLASGMPAPTNLLGTASTTFGTTCNPLAQLLPTGYVTPTNLATAVALGTGTGQLPGFANPCAAAGLPEFIPRLVQNSGTSATAFVAVQQGTVAVGANIPLAAGGGLLRNFASAGVNTTTWLNLSGATTGSRVELQVVNMPSGTSVEFGPSATVTGAGNNTVLVMELAGRGTINAPGGTVTYTVVNNETVASAFHINLPFTVRVATTGVSTGTATVVIRLRPPASSADVPAYAEIPGVSQIPSQTPPILPTTQLALYNVVSTQTTITFPYVLAFGTPGQPASYDTGIVIRNSGQSITGEVTGQTGTFTVYLFPDKATNSDDAAVIAISSDERDFPDSRLLGPGGVLAPGNTYQTLLSNILRAARITGDWKGSMVIVTNFQTTVGQSGFAFISQFANPGGGATLGYMAP